MHRNRSVSYCNCRIIGLLVLKRIRTLRNLAVVLVHGVSPNREEGKLLNEFIERLKNHLDKQSVTFSISSGSVVGGVQHNATLSTKKFAIDIFEPSWLHFVRPIRFSQCLRWIIWQVIRPNYPYFLGSTLTSSKITNKIIFAPISLAISLVVILVASLLFAGKPNLLQVLLLPSYLILCIPAIFLLTKSLSQLVVDALANTKNCFGKLISNCITTIPYLSTLCVLIIASCGFSRQRPEEVFFWLLVAGGLAFVGLNIIREPLLNIVSDVHGYIYDRPARRKISGEITSLLDSIISQGVGKKHYDSTLVLAHSLGAQIAVDSLSESTAMNSYILLDLITFGSAISVIGALFHSVGAFSFQETLNVNNLFRGRVANWSNVWLEDEILGLPLPVSCANPHIRELGSKKNPLSLNVREYIPLMSAIDPVLRHRKYFESKILWKAIVEALKI